MSYDFKVGQNYSFDVYPSNILGTNFKNVKLLAILDCDSANGIIQTKPMHINVFPYLPQGTPNNPEQYNYLKILTASGAVTAIGIPWIKESTVTVVSYKKAIVEIEPVNLEDGPKIAAALIKNGFPNVTVRFE